MYTLVDGVEFYDKDEIDTIVKSITGGTIPDEENIRTELTTKIDEEAAARMDADTALSATLGARIDDEATKRMDADALFSKLIAGEVESRINADTAFANQLTAIEQLHTTLISPNGFIDSDGDAVNVNDSGKSIRQIAHEEFYRQLITDADDVKTQLDTLKELADYLQRNPSIITDMYNKLGITWSVDNPTDFGAFGFSTVLTATNVDDAVLELYNTFTNKIGDLAQLTTTFKDNIVGAINELNAEIDTEATARTDADTALGTRIDEEATARTDADTALGTRIDEEATARTDADTALGTRIDEEATARTDADTALDTKIGDLTQLDTTSKDTIVSAINSEFEWRRKNDEALGTRIDEEVTARTDADTALGTRIDEEVGDLDSLKTTDKSSTVAAINELYDTVQQGGSEPLYVTADTDPETSAITGLSHTYDEIVAEVVKDRPAVLKVNGAYLPLVRYAPLLGFDYDPLVFVYCLGSVSTEDHLHYASVYVSKDGDGNTTAILLGGEVDNSGSGGAGSGGNTAVNCEQFTYVIDSNEALAEWANNDRSKGQDYTSVLIRKGTWTIDSTIDLKTTDTISVVGESGNKLVFNVLQFGFAYNQNGSVDPLELLHLGLSIKGVNVEVNVLSGGMGGGFFNLVNLSNCTSVINNSSTAMGFYVCYNLSNCSCQIAGDNALNSAGFSGCVNLHDCIAEAHGNTKAMAFGGCKTLTGCFGKGVGGTGYGFHMCNGVSRCVALKGSSTDGFGESYADYDAGNCPCADTPDGGFNLRL